MKRVDRIFMKYLIDSQVRAALTSGGKRLPSANTARRSPRIWPPMIVMPTTIARHPTLDELES